MKSYVDHCQYPTLLGHNDTNIVLSVGLQWTIAIQLVCSIARQVIFEDFVVCTATEVKVLARMARYVRWDVRTSIHIDSMRRMQP
jgi:hypothetical protein